MGAMVDEEWAGPEFDRMSGAKKLVTLLTLKFYTVHNIFAAKLAV